MGERGKPIIPVTEDAVAARLVTSASDSRRRCNIRRAREPSWIPSVFIHLGPHLWRGDPIRRTSHMVDFLIRQYVALQSLLVVDRDDEGQGLAEYALILALIAIVAIIALTVLGGNISSILSEIGARI
jgi:pilus assembly protein Flp/PilA